MARLDPEEIANRRFPTGGRRGYDREHVESFLTVVANSYRELLDSEANAPSYEQIGREAGAVLEAARRGAESLRRRAEEEAEALRGGARREAQEIRRSAEAEAGGILERAAQEAERAMRETELVGRRLRNVTKRQCAELLAEAQARQDRLATHERELRQRIADIESLFEVFRAEMDAEPPKVIRLEDVEEAGADALAEAGADHPEEERPAVRLEVEQVQPKPVFENRPSP